MRIFFKLFIVSIALSINTFASAQQFNKGNEQGLEIGKLDLHQDSVAVNDALTGWWSNAQKNYSQRMQWYNEAKFGCFIHWGTYSTAGGEWEGERVYGYAEHLMRIQRIPLTEYREKVVTPFNPVDFDADEWVRLARDAGMRYLIITAKHHDGFAMYFSDAYPYDMQMTRFHRDPMRELREAATRYGLKFGFYYSHAFDWEHPDAPGNDWDYDNPGGDKLLHGKNWWLEYPEFLSHAAKYVNEKSIPQIRELILNYQPDILWFDTPHKLPLFENIRILKAIRDISSDVVVNGRLARWNDNILGEFNFGDYANTGDRAAYFASVETPYWESIPTTNESYGYSLHDQSHKSVSHFVRLLASATAKGGNILMNVGPMGNGTWDKKDIDIFLGIGKWLKTNGKAIYGNVVSGIPVQNWGVTTRKNDTLYLHVYQYPKDGKLIVGGLSADIKNAFFLATGKTVACHRFGNEDMIVQLPAVCPDTMNTVVALHLKTVDYTTGKSRLLMPDETNILLTFDAKTSSGMTFGDGKKYRNYVQNWTNENQTVTWKTRLLQPTSYQIYLEFNKDNPADSGVIAVEINGKSYEVAYSSHEEVKHSDKLYITTVKLPSGEHTIVLKGIRYTGKQYLRPMSLILKTNF